MPLAALFALDAVAVTLLALGIYFPRHRRKDMLAAYFGINIGVLGVTQALASAEVSAGLGLGLLGVLSIIRLRSAELDQPEIAYYFAALTLGLLGGFPLSPAWLSPLLMAGILLAVYVGDHPLLFARYRHQVITLDRAFTNETRVRDHLEHLLGAKVHRVQVRKVDLVQDTTTVEVRYEVPSRPEPSAAYAAAEFEVRQ